MNTLRSLLAPPAERPSPREAIGLPLLALAIFAAMFALFILPELRVGGWNQLPCTVLDSRVTACPDDTFRPEILIRYSLAGETREVWSTRAHAGCSSGRSGKQETVARYRAGVTRTCWVHPDDPERIVLLRGFGPETWALLLPVLLFALGLPRLVWSVRSHGRTASVPRHRVAEPFRPPILPGESLAFRLPLRDAGGGLLGASVLALVPLGLGAGLGLMAPGAFAQTTPGGLVASGLAALFSGLGLWLGLAAVREARLARATRTVIESSAFPAPVGTPLELRVEQHGTMRFESLGVELICHEQVLDEEGGAGWRRIASQVVLAPRALEVGPASPFVHSACLELVADANPSSAKRATSWSIVVSGRTAEGMLYLREATLAVAPAEGSSS